MGAGSLGDSFQERRLSQQVPVGTADVRGISNLSMFPAPEGDYHVLRPVPTLLEELPPISCTCLFRPAVTSL